MCEDKRAGPPQGFRLSEMFGGLVNEGTKGRTMTTVCTWPACMTAGCLDCSEAVEFAEDDEPDDQCLHCRGDGMDPDCDYLLPCPDCGGSW